MTKEEFEEIIKPLYLMSGNDCQFMRSTLLGNFDNWYKNKQCNIDVVVGRSEQLKAFFEFLEFRDYLNCDSTNVDQIIKDHIESL